MDTEPTKVATAMLNTASNSTNSTTAPAATSSSPTYKITHETFYAVILTLSLFGNLAMLSILAKQSRLKSSSNILLLNMVIAELAVAASIPFDIVAIEYDGSWPYGEVMCKVLYPLQTLPYGALVLSITAMSYYRYKGIVFPLKRNLGRIRVNIMIALIWIVSLVIVVPYSVFLDFTSDTGCGETWSEFAGKCYTVVLFLTHYAIPLCIMGYCYAKIAMKLCSSRNETRRRHSICSGSKRAIKQRETNSLRVARMVILFVLVFAICMLPHHAVWLYITFGKNAVYNDSLLTYAYLFTFTSTFANPLIYFTHNPNFRTELSHSLCRCCHSSYSPEKRTYMSTERERTLLRESKV